MFFGTYTYIIIIIITDIFYIVALEVMSRYNYSLWWEIDPFNKEH